MVKYHNCPFHGKEECLKLEFQITAKHNCSKPNGMMEKVRRAIEGWFED